MREEKHSNDFEQILLRVGSLVGATSALSFLLGLAYQDGTFFVLSLNLLELFTLSDYANLTIIWLPPAVVVGVIAVLIPLSLTIGEARALRRRQKLERLRDAVSAFFEGNGLFWAAIGIFAVAVFMLALGSVFSYYRDSQAPTLEFITVRQIRTFQIEAGMLGFILMLLSSVAMLTRKSKYVAYAGFLATLLCFIAILGSENGLDLLTSKVEIFKVDCEAPACSGDYKVAYTLDRYVILIGAKNGQVNWYSPGDVKIEIVAREKIRMITKIDTVK